MHSEPAAPLQIAPTRTLYTDITTVLVGPAHRPKKYYVHTRFLTSLSTFFAAALRPSSSFLEAGQNEIHLPEVEPRIFEFWVQWLYTLSLAHEDIDWDGPSPAVTDRPDEPLESAERGADSFLETREDVAEALLPSSTSPSLESGQCTPPTPKNRKPRRNPKFFLLIQLYQLAGFLGCEDLRNQIIDEVARVAERRNAAPGPDDSHEIMSEKMGDREQGIRKKSEEGKATGGGKRGGLRELVLDLFVGMRTEALIRGCEGWHEGFLKELFVKMKAREKGNLANVPIVEPWKDENLRCLTYHEHVETERCVRWIEGSMS